MTFRYTVKIYCDECGSIAAFSNGMVTGTTICVGCAVKDGIWTGGEEKGK